jgi:hypothetical protein
MTLDLTAQLAPMFLVMTAMVVAAAFILLVSHRD